MHPKQHCGIYYVPHQGNNKEGGSLLDLKVGHKCNELARDLKHGGGLTWCKFRGEDVRGHTKS